MKNNPLNLKELLGRTLHYAHVGIVEFTLSLPKFALNKPKWVSLPFSISVNSIYHNPLFAHASQSKAGTRPSHLSRLFKNLVFVFLFLSFSLVKSQMPPLNQKILNFVKQNMGKTVDRGECWDLAAVPLYEFKAKWDGSFQFGKLLDPEKDVIFPGDIIQFFDVVFEYKKDDVLYKETMGQHTAIVYKVIAKKHYEIAHQNTSEWGRIVQTSTINLKDLKVGKIYFYRPQPQ